MGPSLHARPPGITGGGAEAEEYLGETSLIPRSEYVRLLAQALDELGHPGLSKQLQAESGIEMQPEAATAFRDAVLSGSLDEAVSRLPALASQGSDLGAARFLLLRQRYEEALGRGDAREALRCLREELAPLALSPATLQELTAKILTSGVAGENGGAGSSPGGGENGGGARDGADEVSSLATPTSPQRLGGSSAALGAPPPSGASVPGGRQQLLVSLQELLPPSVLVPEGRLLQLVEQAVLAQLQVNKHTNVDRPRVSLFTDYKAGVEGLPGRVAHVLTGHRDEVWVVAFSRDGRWLGSASKDGTAVLWEVGGPAPSPRAPSSSGGGSSVDSARSVRYSRHLARASQPLSTLAFAPDSRSVLVSGADGLVRRVSTETGETIQSISLKDGDTPRPVNACAWFPDGTRFVLATIDLNVTLVEAVPPATPPPPRSGGPADGEGALPTTVAPDAPAGASGRGQPSLSLPPASPPPPTSSLGFFQALGGGVAVGRRPTSQPAAAGGDDDNGGAADAGSAGSRGRRAIARAAPAASRVLKQPQHVYDLAVSPDGSTLVTVGQDRRIRFTRVSDGKEASCSESGAVTCLATSPDGALLLANLSNHAVHLWPLGDLRAPATPGAPDPLDALPSAPLMEYASDAPAHGRFVIRSTLGGARNGFVACGSEDGRIHIWHRESGELLTSLSGHSGTVNAVAWNPADHGMLASASDDGTIRVWVAQSAGAASSLAR